VSRQRSDRGEEGSPFVTMEELGRILGCDRNRAAALVDAGVIPSFPIEGGRRLVHRAEAEEFREFGRTKRWRSSEVRPGSADVNWSALLEGLADAFRAAARPTSGTPARPAG
jgi:hypothetical protein